MSGCNVCGEHAEASVTVEARGEARRVPFCDRCVVHVDRGLAEGVRDAKRARQVIA